MTGDPRVRLDRALERARVAASAVRDGGFEAMSRGQVHAHVRRAAGAARRAAELARLIAVGAADAWGRAARAAEYAAVCCRALEEFERRVEDLAREGE